MNLKIAERQADLDNAKAAVERATIAMEDAARLFEDAERKAKAIEIELNALLEADKLRPATAEADKDASRDTVIPSRRKGRQPGSISKKWRDALTDFVAVGNHPVEISRFYLMTRARLGLAESSVRERVRQYVATGILLEQEGSICVSKAAIDKFRLTTAAMLKAAEAHSKGRSLQ